MFVDRMHTQAIADADKYQLPQTVYRQGKDWYHSESTGVKMRMSFPNVAPKIVPVVTWLPKRFFA